MSFNWLIERNFAKVTSEIEKNIFAEVTTNPYSVILFHNRANALALVSYLKEFELIII